MIFFGSFGCYFVVVDHVEVEGEKKNQKSVCRRTKKTLFFHCFAVLAIGTTYFSLLAITDFVMVGDC